MIVKLNTLSRDLLAALALIYSEYLAFRRGRSVLRPADMFELLSQGGIRGLDQLHDSPPSEWHYKGVLNHLYTVMRLRGVCSSSGVQNGRLLPFWSNFCVSIEGF